MYLNKKSLFDLSLYLATIVGDVKAKVRGKYVIGLSVIVSSNNIPVTLRHLFQCDIVYFLFVTPDE